MSSGLSTAKDKMDKVLQIGCINPFDQDKPHYPQQEFMSLSTTGGMKFLHFVSGRGGGKTLIAVVKVLQVMLDEPGTRGLVLSPTYQQLRDVFLSCWQDIVPNELCHLRRAEMIIEVVNGSRAYLRSRHVNNPSRGRDATRGLDVSWVADDESADGFDKQLINNVLACCRRPGRHRFYASFTTPRLNAYHKFATNPSHKIVHSSTRNNPHVPQEWIDAVEAEMSPQQAKRELGGEWVALEGLVWDTWSNELWPRGNLHEHRYTPDLPWVLWLDLGVGNGAYLVVQPIMAEWCGRVLHRDPVWVVVAELMPTHDGSAARAFGKLKSQFGQPAMIVSGADINTRSNSDGTTPAYFAKQIFGGTPVYPIRGWVADKQIQYDRTSALILDGSGNRRLCMSEGLIELERGADRGMKQLVAQDSWPEGIGRTRPGFFAKEGRLEHVRDALLYGCTHINEPTFGIDRIAG
jgi:hypothetical protein